MKTKIKKPHSAYSKIITSALIFVSFFAWGTAFASTSITNVSGTVSHGSTITITGSEFGTKPMGAPVKYDDFQSINLGSEIVTSLAPGPVWLNNSGFGQNFNPIASATRLRSGTPFTRNFQGHWIPQDVQGVSNVALVNQTFNKFIIDAWTYMDTSALTSGHISNTKIFRLHATGAESPSADLATPINPCESIGGWTPAQRDGVTEANNDPGDWADSDDGVPMCNRWVHVQWLIDAGSGNNTPNGALYTYIDGVLRYNHSGIATQGAGHTSWPEIYVGNYINDNNGPWTGNYYQYWENVYIDSSWARVELGDAPTYTASTHREIQVPSSWADDSITATINRGSFAPGSTAYLYVIDANNNASSGYPVVIGDDGTTSPPPPPPPPPGPPTPPPPPPPDTTAPVISSTTSSGISQTGAIINWITDEISDSQVEYGTTTSYGLSSVLDSALVSAHSVSLIDLLAGFLYHFRVSSRDAFNNLATSTDFTFTTLPPPDTTAPTVNITSPTDGTFLRGTLTLSATATDNVGVAGLQFLLDAANLGSEDVTSPYSVSWNTTASANGLHTISARARDAMNNSSTTNIVVTVDNQAPTGSILINNGANITNSTTTILTLSAVDNLSGVSQMRFSNTGSSFSTAENYSGVKNWTLSTGSGTKTVFVQFKDGAGNWSSSFTDTIILDTTAPTISNIIASSINGNGATITWTTNEPSTSQVDYGPTTSYGSSTPIDNNLVTSHSVVLTGLKSATNYRYRVRSSDSAMNEKVSNNNSFTTPDNVSPSVPTLSATVTLPNRVNLSWTASVDNVGVTGYSLYRNGVQIATFSSSTRTYQDRNLATSTTYTYRVSARDSAGNFSAQSSPITVSI